MDATHRVFCGNDMSNPITSMGMQVSCILVISHFFNILLKAFGQPGPIAQILAGLVLGPSGMSNIEKVKNVFIQDNSTDINEVFSFFCRILFMFLIGLETDIRYMIRNIRMANILASGGAIVGSIFGFAVSFYVYQQIGGEKNMLPFNFIIMLVLAYTASPIVIRLAVELKFATSDIGRIVISSAIINEMFCLVLFNLIVGWHIGKFHILGKGILSILVTGAVVLLNWYLSVWLNKRNWNQKYLKSPEVLLILSLVIASSMITELMAFNSIINCFVIGLLFPKEGKTARTLLHKLRYSIHNFVLPIYFGYIGFQVNFASFKGLNEVLLTFIMVLLGIGGKLSGTLFACHYLHIPSNEAIFLGFLLNLRGHADLLFISSALKQLNSFGDQAYNVMFISIVINTILSGIIVSFLISGEAKMFAHTRTTLELQRTEDELRLLACVYGSRHISVILALISALHGNQTSPISCHLMHLIELIKKSKSNLLYHEKEEHDFSDEEDYGGNDVVQIHEAVDAFTVETKIPIQQSKAVSSFAGLFKDVCDLSEDLRVSITLLPFHKHQRIDGKMESGKEGIRTTNQKVLRHAPCSVGVVVERGLAGVPGFSQLIGSSPTMQNVATLFFGGPDDREAIAWSIRIAKHPHVNMTIIRFLSASSSENEHIDNHDQEQREVVMALQRGESLDQTLNQIDNTFMVDFYNRYVASNQVEYVEKYVNNGAQTVEALKDIGGMFSLFIVGKGGPGHSPLTTALSDWEECPELGTVGDILASSDFKITGSVLVVQQHRQAKRAIMNE
ncbi:Cation/H(+) antiporter like [Quillaja saponaria]|uniref:Cation/H(+) antiporter like n=1 Tax=Quillaja saponaria TaxID=32244 RepID=A0AAD7PVR2_QUISA|nr:Cation/H(+) antiporter like [Quillaja saponaria]